MTVTLNVSARVYPLTMTRDQLIATLWRLVEVVEATEQRWAALRGLTAGSPAHRQISGELNQLKAAFDGLGGPQLLPADAVDSMVLTAIVVAIEDERASTVRGAIRVLEDDERAARARVAERSRQRRARRADHEARMASDHAAWANAQRTRWAITDAVSDLGRRLRP
ncbi:hypothetical protein GCM10027169_00170 [Gordonia jinhuaensis]|uniref:Uncharacterized protein n=1 Tax=Gordonia jinhuaensis TaxID=1517702 RepID=A0A916WPT5_9ACTN|nr:hypothetical protein GCM10011489_02830 [Gordonia jinhuaensis]